MPKQIILITGGARSGKSKYAEERAAGLGPRRLLYVATAEAKDDEMAHRIAAHQKRRGSVWTTVEEPVQLAETLLAGGGRTDCALVDCLTLWLSNLILRGDESVEEKVENLVQTLPRLDFSVVFVTNEVGAGIVPDNPLARRFRDLAGWTNQRLAALAHEVVLMVAGIPMIIKKDARCS